VAGNGTQGFSGDGGPATSAQLGNHIDVAVDSSGNLLIDDSDNSRIRFVPPAQDFVLSINPTSTAVKSGQSVTYNLTITPTGDLSRSQTIALTCSEPADLTNSSCTVAPGSVTLSGALATTATVTVSTVASSMALGSLGSIPAQPFFALWLPLVGIGIVRISSRSGTSKPKMLGLLSCSVLIAGLALQTACGGGGGSTGTHPGTYTITVMGTSGSMKHSTAALLTVR